ncbi:uncharacterized protein DNG_03913 [Cephalotrichum gorgonifer]|uniref:Uncharacterized protein n=1 Tax=Cephalotrichum gorgonifer TaxID=2041049 RepID=A0AAE8MV21_9PEZI|nr:uncharacterized protein DNG_03913 [Cephalotrichum gorgonifer]
MASPARRALAPLDANKPSPSPANFKSPIKQSALGPIPNLLPGRTLQFPRSPARELKRPLEVVEDRAGKKACTGPREPPVVMPTARGPSASPDASSVFDSRDNSQTQTTNSTAMERDSSRQRAQTRKMAGDLVARLRLAKYKVRTGQADVPFVQLEASMSRVEVRVQHASPGPSRPRQVGVHGGEYARARPGEMRGDSMSRTEGALLPALPTYASSLSPHRSLRDEGMLNNVRRGGAATGLLRFSSGPNPNGYLRTLRKTEKTQADRSSTVKEPREPPKGEASPEKLPHISKRSTVSSSLRSATPISRASTCAGKPKSPQPQPAGGSRKDNTSDRSEMTVTSAAFGEAPLRSYTGPTPKSLDGVRAAFFETKGMSLESIREWEWHCFQADIEVFTTAMKNKRIAGAITGHDEAAGFTGPATTRGTLNLWLLSQAKFNGLKVLALWARLASPAWASGMVLDDESEWLLEARVPALQVRLLRGVMHDTLRDMAQKLSLTEAQVKRDSKALARLSRKAEGAFANWPWPECGSAVPDIPPKDIDPEYEDHFPLAAVSRSVNSILKRSNRKIDAQILETERVRSTVNVLREDLDEMLLACDEAIREIERQGREAEDLKDECEYLKKMVRDLRHFKETTVAKADASEAEHERVAERLRHVEKELEMHKYKGELFDALCQEVRMVPFGLRSVEAAVKRMDALRSWVRAKEELFMEKWGAAEEPTEEIAEEAPERTRQDENGFQTEVNGVVYEDENEADVDGDVEDTSFTSGGSLAPASSVSVSASYSISSLGGSEEQY